MHIYQKNGDLIFRRRLLQYILSSLINVTWTSWMAGCNYKYAQVSTVNFFILIHRSVNDIEKRFRDFFFSTNFEFSSNFEVYKLEIFAASRRARVLFLYLCSDKNVLSSNIFKNTVPNSSMFHYVAILCKIQSSVLWVNKTWVLFIEEFSGHWKKGCGRLWELRIHIY